jgi:uncharacterized membrane protein
LVWILISIIGILLLFVGVFVAYPLVILSQCYVYRLLNNPVAVAEEEEIAQDLAGK